MDQSKVSSEETLRLFLLELSCLLKEFVDLKKKLISSEFLNRPKQPDESTQETDKDMDNKEIVNVANPTDYQDAVIKE